MSTVKDGIIVDSILHSEEDLLAAYECHRVFPQAIGALIRRRGDKIRTAMAARPELQTFLCCADANPAEAYAAPLDCHDSALQSVNLLLLIEAQARPLRSMLIGVHWKGGHKNESPELAQRIFTFFNKEFRQGKSNEWWPWYTHLCAPWDNWENVHALRALYGDDLTEPENDMLTLCTLSARFFAMPHGGISA